MRAIFHIFLSLQAWGATTRCPADYKIRALLPNPCTALESEKREIADRVAEGVEAADFAKAAKNAADAANKAGDKRTELQQLEIAAMQRKLAENKFNESLILTAQYYNFKPKDSPDTKIQGGPFKDQRATWRAQYFDDGEHFRKVPGSDRDHYLRIKPIDKNAGVIGAAGTKDDGEIAARDSLFRMVNYSGIELLAAVLYHETAHFNILTSPSPPKTKVGHELAAAEAELLQLAVFEIEDSPNNKFDWYYKSLKLDIAMYKDAIANPQGKDSALFGSPYVIPELEAKYKIEFGKEEQRQADLRNHEEDLRKEVERLNAQRKAEQEALRRETEKIAKFARWNSLKLWTLYACSYIRGVRYGDPEWGDNARISAQEQLYMEYISGHFIVLDRAELQEGLKKGNFFPGDVGTCQKQFISMFRDLPGPVDLDWLLARIQYEKRGGRIGEIIRGILKAVGEALQSGESPIVKSASKPSSGESSPESRKEREEHGGGGVKDLDGEAWRQLRGIGVKDW